MITPEDLSIMTEQEKLDLLKQVAESDDWQECFEPIYAQLMNDDSPRVRGEAIAALWDLADPQYIEPLMRKAENDSDTDVRGKAVSVLGIYVYDAAMGMSLDHAQYMSVRRFLLDAANDPDEELFVRRMAVEALSFDTDEEVHDLIEWAYNHPNLEVRMSALFAMGRSQAPRYHDLILQELDSKEPRLRQEAINAAGEARLAAAAPKLRALTRNPDREMCLAAIWALAHAGGPGALEALELCAQAEDEEVRRVAQMAIDEFQELQQADQDSDLDDFDDDDFDDMD